jgi:N-acetylglucosaminyldiphosphoundecaprenol N-acetyl-beta-D-mannosaminyltransferase
MPFEHQRILGINVDAVGQGAAIQEIIGWCNRGEQGVVVTPNLDHAVKLRRDMRFRHAYEHAGLVLADGAPLVWLSRLAGRRLERVTGSDLILPLCRSAAAEGRSIFLLGSTSEILSRAAATLSRSVPSLEIAGTYAPPFGFLGLPDELKAAVDIVKSANPAILFLALGAPQQEIWADESGSELGVPAIVCCGAGLDFLAGAKQRAPAAMRRLGFEWLWRIATDPSRLGPRYGKIILLLPLLLVEHFRVSRQMSTARYVPAGGAAVIDQAPWWGWRFAKARRTTR